MSITYTSHSVSKMCHSKQNKPSKHTNSAMSLIYRQVCGVRRQQNLLYCIREHPYLRPKVQSKGPRHHNLSVLFYSHKPTKQSDLYIR